MENRIKLLLVDDEKQFLDALCQRLEFREFSVTPVNNGTEAIAEVKKGGYEIALVDLKMPEIDGEELLKLLKQEDPFLEVIILTGQGSIDSAIRSTKKGAISYLHKPCPMDTLLHVLNEAHQGRVRKMQGYNNKNK